MEYLILNKDSISWISNDIDCFVSQSLGNEIIQSVSMCPHEFNGHSDAVREKVGQAVGNLQALGRIYIVRPNYHDDDDDDIDVLAPLPDWEVLPMPDWEMLACVLTHVRQPITLTAIPYDAWILGRSLERFVGIPLLRVLRGLATISPTKPRMRYVQRW